MKPVCKEAKHNKLFAKACGEGSGAAYSDACMRSCIDDVPPSPDDSRVCDFSTIIQRPQKPIHDWCLRGYSENFKQVRDKALGERQRLLQDDNVGDVEEEVKDDGAAAQAKIDATAKAVEEKKIADAKVLAKAEEKVAAAKAAKAKKSEPVTNDGEKGGDASDVANDGHPTIQQGVSDEEKKLEEMAAEMMRKNAIEMAKRELEKVNAAKAGQ